MDDTKRPLLLVEDSDPDAEAMQRLARRLPLSWPVVRVSDGETALEYLYQRGVYKDVPRPVMVLLDLHLPGIGGREILGQLKGDPVMRALPVIIFSNSKRTEDVDAAYDAGANSYLFKPNEPSELKHVANALEQFWFNVARLPGVEVPRG
jgi:two-component system, chemotaxis family, response regulator Rcp1